MGFGSAWGTLLRPSPCALAARRRGAPVGCVHDCITARRPRTGPGDNPAMRIALLGTGLIGGSIARALRVDRATAGGTASTIAAWSPAGDGPRAAAEAGVVDRVGRDLWDTVDGAEIVVLAGPPLACLDLVDELAGRAADLAPDALVTDVASTKSAIVARAAARRLPFVGGHPMAGRELSGFGAATADLFAGAPWIVVPGPSSPADGVDRVSALALACGARPVTMDAAEHDAAVAAVSHLPLVVAAALVEAVAGRSGGPTRPDWPSLAALAAGGWSSMTRLARGDVAMSTGIAATNAPAIADRLRELRTVLDGWLADLEAVAQDSPSADGRAVARLEKRFRAARERLGPPEDGAT